MRKIHHYSLLVLLLLNIYVIAVPVILHNDMKERTLKWVYSLFEDESIPYLNPHFSKEAAIKVTDEIQNYPLREKLRAEFEITSILSALINSNGITNSTELGKYIAAHQYPNGGFGQFIYEPGLEDFSETSLLISYYALLSLTNLNKVELINKCSLLSFLKDCYNQDGGFGVYSGDYSDTFTTSLGIEMLLSLGAQNEFNLTSTINFIKESQYLDDTFPAEAGGFGFNPNDTYPTITSTYSSLGGLYLLNETPYNVIKALNYISLRKLSDGSFTDRLHEIELDDGTTTYESLFEGASLESSYLLSSASVYLGKSLSSATINYFLDFWTNFGGFASIPTGERQGINVYNYKPELASSFYVVSILALTNHIERLSKAPEGQWIFFSRSPLFTMPILMLIITPHLIIELRRVFKK